MIDFILEQLVTWWQFTVVGILIIIGFIINLFGVDNKKKRIGFEYTEMPHMQPITIPTDGKGFWSAIWMWLTGSRKWTVAKDFIFKIDGVDYLVYGAITDMSSEAEEISTGGFASVRVSNRFGVDIKIVDALSGEIRRAESIVAVIETGSGVATRSFSNVQADTNGLVEAQRIVAKRSAALLAESIFPIRVVDIFNDEIYLNYGDSILTVGDRLKVIQEGREIIDQDTGLSLGTRQRVLGEIEIVSADSNLSIAKIIKNDAEFTVGAVAKIILETLGSKNKQQRERKGKQI